MKRTVSKKTRKNRKEVWHRWFAWYPVMLDKEKVWLKTVMRIGELHDLELARIWCYCYKELN